jgi:hypothetical protein
VPRTIIRSVLLSSMVNTFLGMQDLPDVWPAARDAPA